MLPLIISIQQKTYLLSSITFINFIFPPLLFMQSVQDGTTAMQCALKAGNLWIVEMLLAAGAQPDLMVKVIALYAH